MSTRLRGCSPVDPGTALTVTGALGGSFPEHLFPATSEVLMDGVDSEAGRLTRHWKSTPSPSSPGWRRGGRSEPT